jgi:hypothetical protein
LSWLAVVVVAFQAVAVAVLAVFYLLQDFLLPLELLTQ